MIPPNNLTLSEDLEVPVYRLNTVVLGAGAAGMNCAVHLHEFLSAKGVPDAEDRIAVVTAGIGLGASRMSGSDKQTFYKVGTDPQVPDSALDFARTLTSAGCMHGDIALAEAASSLRAFFHLVQVGVPFPHDPEGGFVGYKTDHDPRARATSIGPTTSKVMSECLQRQAERYGIRIFDKHEAAHFLTRTAGGERRIVGLVTIDKERILDAGFGITVFLCQNIVLAAGGPGALFEVSVYPHGQVGVHGLAFKARLKAHNMQEWQFGLASTRFRWNVSGTYMQVVPRIFSTDKDGGNVREFLTPHFQSMPKMATNIFLKGYQWPFDAHRVTDHQSSLIDLLTTIETRHLGRRVFMDFTQNPIPGPGMEPFKLADLEEEALSYLRGNEAMQATPIERLAHMNPLAIDIYAEHDIDIRKEPLEIDVCAQHQNGGFAVDKWWQSNIPHTFVIGEMAGTHGVKRPGGAALNSGQVGAIRAAEYIAAVYGGDVADESLLQDDQRRQICDLRKKFQAIVGNASGGQSVTQTLAEIQKRSTTGAAHMRRLETAQRCLDEASALVKTVARTPPTVRQREDIIAAIQVEHLALTQAALLESLVAYLKRGGGSRGSYMVLSDHGREIGPDLINPETGRPYRFIPENESLRQEIIEIALDDAAEASFTIQTVRPRPIPEYNDAFEKLWAAFREGTIYETG